MAKNYQDLMNEVLADGARTDKYNLVLNLPIKSKHENADKYTSILCKNASFPKRSVSKQDYMFKGHAYSIGTQVESNDQLTLTFYNQEDHLNRRFFEEWIEGYDAKGGYVRDFRNDSTNEVNGFENCYRSIAIDHFFIDQYKFIDNIDLNNLTIDPMIRYQFYGVFPTELSTIELNGEGDDIETFTVTFAYTFYEVHKMHARSVIQSVNR